MAEIVTYLLSDEKSPFILNGDLSNDYRQSGIGETQFTQSGDYRRN